MKTMACAVCAMVCGLMAQAGTWYADASHFGRDGMNGTTPETAFGTIQEAVDRAQQGDTVSVAEGVYDKGATTCVQGAMDARVSITNKITLLASGAREKTVIVGRHASTASGVGEDAVRCVYIDEKSGGKDLTGVVVRGFTIRDGGVKESKLGTTGSGGGVHAGSHYSLGDLIIDCDIVNCIGSRGGAVKGGVSVRCRFFANSCDYTGAVGRDAAFWNCLVVANGLNPNLFEGCQLVNCTVVGNAGATFSSGTCAVNMICADNGKLNCRSDMKTCKGSVFALPNEAGATLADGMENVVCDETAGYALIAPLFGDFRVVRGHPAETSGRLSYMSEVTIHSFIPAAERYLDLNGNAIVERDGSICAGALQETAVRAASGGGIAGAGVGRWTVCGWPTTTENLWAFPSEYPAMIRIDQFRGTDIVAFDLSDGKGGMGKFRLPQLDGTFHVLPPVGREEILPVCPFFATKVICVDRNAGSDETGDGTAEAPYASIQKGVDAASHMNLVRCAAGVYDNGGRDYEGMPCRVNVHDPNKSIFVRGAGPSSVIVGQRTTGGGYGGCGTDSMRCVNIYGVSFVQGFTLSNGSCFASSTVSSATQGGAVRSTDNRSGFSDLVIEDCGGYSGVVYGGWLQRCVIRNCTAYRPLVRNAGWVAGCDFEGNKVTEWGILFYEYPVYDTTLRCSSGGETCFPNGQLLYNSVVTGGSVLPNITNQNRPDGYPGCIAWGFSSYTPTPEAAGYLKADPQYATSSNGYLLATSPAFASAGAVVSPETAWQTNYHLFATVDLKGVPRQFVQGRIVPGAYAWPTAKVTVDEPLVGTTTQAGDHVLYRGDELSVAYAPDPDRSRLFLGYATNGVLATTATAYTLTDVRAGAAYVLTPVVSTNWYVDATSGDDANSGFTPDAAKRTLRSVMEDVCLLPGDCVHAAEGDYCEGMMFPRHGTYSDANLGLTTNRVVVNEGVSLVADGARERTIIRGVKGNVSAGCGPGALRCAFLYPKTLLKGFTLADGATATHATPSGSSNDDHSGGGVLTKGVDATAYVEGCVFTNCSARNGGGAFGGYMVNCRFTGCKAANSGGSLRNCWRLFGCVIEDGSVNGPYGVDSCTFGPTAVLSAYGGSSAGSRLVKNSLVLGTVESDASCRFTVSNSLFVEGKGLEEGVTAGYVVLDKPQSEIILPADRLTVDGAFMPAKGSAAVDAGVNAAIPAALGGRDALGHQRVWNGTVDIGAVEYDWRGDFAQALGGTRLEVTEASPDVTLAAGGVRLADGATLSAVWRGIRAGSVRRWSVSVLGDGALAASVNGGEPLSVTSAGSGVKRYRAAGETDTLAFAYAGGGSAVLKDFLCNPGLMLIIR